MMGPTISKIFESTSVQGQYYEFYGNSPASTMGEGLHTANSEWSA